MCARFALEDKTNNSIIKRLKAIVIFVPASLVSIAEYNLLSNKIAIGNPNETNNKP